MIPLPRNTALIAAQDRLAYLDTQSATLAAPVTPMDAWRRIMADPLPGLGLAFRLRDAISARFGVARIGGFTGQAVGQPAPGERLDFFLVEAISETALTLTARDRHLDVMVSVVCDGHDLGLTASVVTHNWFGRAYMLPVGIAHRWIVAAMLRRLARSVRMTPGRAEI